MTEAKTNLAQLLKMLGARPRDLCEAVNADKSLASRWLGGKQKLMPGHGWIGKVADYLLAMDGRLKDPVIPGVLSAYYPDEAFFGDDKRRATLLDWLAVVGHERAEHQGEQEGLAGLVMRRVETLSGPQPGNAPKAEAAPEPPPMKNTTVYGIEGVQGSVLQFLNMVMRQPEPGEMLFACPEGLDMLTKDKWFHLRLMDTIMEIFAAGHRMSVVARTDYRVSDIAGFSGPWLVAHLLGYIQSYYYDDFVRSSKEKMLAVVPGRMAIRVSEAGDRQIHTSLHFDARTVDDTHAAIKGYQAKSKQRFHYRLFEQPDGFLRETHPMADRAHYQLARLPHFGVAEENIFRESFSLTEAEMEAVRLDFSPFLTYPGFFEEDTPARHIFCESDIEAALLKSRHLSQELSAILGRRVFMTTQALANRLLIIKKMLAKHKNYEVCFLREEHFNKLTMQIACWGDKAAIGWIAGGKSTACRDYINVNALTGFCEEIWGDIPSVMKSSSIALRKLNAWLKLLEKCGYKGSL